MYQQREKNRDFAAGCNEYDGAACPALTAGYDPESHECLEMVEFYDAVVRRRHGIDDGIISEPAAKECWWEAIHTLEDKGDAELAVVGRDIAAELGWDEI